MGRKGRADLEEIPVFVLLPQGVGGHVEQHMRTGVCTASASSAICATREFLILDFLMNGS